MWRPLTQTDNILGNFLSQPFFQFLPYFFEHFVYISILLSCAYSDEKEQKYLHSHAQQVCKCIIASVALWSWCT